MWKQWCYISSCEKFRRHITHLEQLDGIFSGNVEHLCRMPHYGSAGTRLSWCIFIYSYTIHSLSLRSGVLLLSPKSVRPLALHSQYCHSWYGSAFHDRISWKSIKAVSALIHLFGSNLSHTHCEISVTQQAPCHHFSSSGTGSLTNSALWKSKRHHHALNKQDGSKKKK